MFKIFAAVLAVGIVLGMGAELYNGTSLPLPATVAATDAPTTISPQPN